MRFDPLLGSSSRIVEGVRLQSGDPAALDVLKDSSVCPFCPPRLEQLTPQIPPEISAEPRIIVGDTTVFPNLVPYSQYSAVAIFSPAHWLGLDDFTPTAIRDNLQAAIEYMESVYGFDAGAAFASYNVNYLYPSGGSLPHAHSQIYLDPYPTTMTRVLLESGNRYRDLNNSIYWSDIVDEEECRGERFIGRIGDVSWFTPFAPIGFNEVRAVLPRRFSLLDIQPAELDAFATGIARVLKYYDSIGYNSFNLALYSGRLDGSDSGFPLNLTMITRSALMPYYRSDAMYLERLHWEAAVDRAPETVAAEIKAVWLVQ